MINILQLKAAKIYKPVFVYALITVLIDPYLLSRAVFVLMFVYMFFNRRSRIGINVNYILFKSFLVGRILGGVMVGLLWLII